jgi:hypothetical protein
MAGAANPTAPTDTAPLWLIGHHAAIADAIDSVRALYKIPVKITVVVRHVDGEPGDGAVVGDDDSALVIATIQALEAAAKVAREWDPSWEDTDPEAEGFEYFNPDTGCRL